MHKLLNRNFKKMHQFFGFLSKTHEYEKIHQYFDPGINIPIKILLKTKGESLQRYLEKNSNSNLFKKMRILFQIYTFVNVLWE